MPRGPNGERRPADTVGCAVVVAKIATGETEETAYETTAKAGWWSTWRSAPLGNA